MNVDSGSRVLVLLRKALPLCFKLDASQTYISMLKAGWETGRQTDRQTDRFSKHTIRERGEAKVHVGQ